jgi:hypothetical protein
MMINVCVLVLKSEQTSNQGGNVALRCCEVASIAL